MKTSRISDITNHQYGSLIAISPEYKSTNNLWYWKFQCVCGKSHIARANTVKYEAKKGDPELPSCGCVELARKTKHGFRKATDTHPAYKAYRSMLSRCYNKNTPGKKWYLESGVTVCEEWLNNPKAFIEWSIQHGWAPGLQIDKDILCKEKGIYPAVYSPETCQWISAKRNVGFATNRDNYGKHPNIKLSYVEVAEILDLYHSGELTNQSELARRYGLKSPASIRRLIKLAEQEVQGNA